jgi:hypothetical protein
MSDFGCAQSNLQKALRCIMPFSKRLLIILTLAAFVTLGAQVCFAQSTDQSLPTPVQGNEISATIPALDLGDARLTRHFYAFEATPGDLMVTVNSRNLNGDVDIFTAVTFRPLTKVTIYANTIPPEVTKSIYFRSNQILILRVEARTPNDDPGVYRITFGGSFKPFSGGIPVAENQESSSETNPAGDRNPNRLSSVGATIERPATEAKAEENKPEVAPEKTPAETANTRRATPRSTRRSTPRPRPGRRRTPPPKPAPAETAKEETAKSPPEETKPTVAEKEEKSGEKRAETPPAQEPSGPHLIVEQKDGTKIDRPMSTVRRVIVESGVIVIVLKTGRIERIRMSDVARMAIEP